MAHDSNDPTLVVGQLNFYYGVNLAAALKLLRERPELDVLCLQEVYGEDLLQIADALGMSEMYAFVKMGLHTPTFDKDIYRGGMVGLAILGKQPIEDAEWKDLGVFYDDPNWPFWKQYDDKPLRSMLLFGVYPLDGFKVAIATTHGSWAPDAAEKPPTPLQREQLTLINQTLRKEGGFGSTILAADFNRRCAPSPMGTFHMEELDADFRSSLPPGTVTTIDPSHRGLAEKHFEVPVDNIYHTSDLQCVECTLHTGYSDHLYVEGRYEWIC